MLGGQSDDFVVVDFTPGSPRRWRLAPARCEDERLAACRINPASTAESVPPPSSWVNCSTSARYRFAATVRPSVRGNSMPPGVCRDRRL